MDRRQEFHFSEDILENILDPGEGNSLRCSACTLPIFSTPFQREGDFHLHNSCSNLPSQFKPAFHPKHPLSLIKKLAEDDEGIICGQCKKKCEGFFYQCLDGCCNFIVDVLCVMPIGTIKIMHRCHKHELVPICEEISFTCGICKSKHEVGSRQAYLCNLCHFIVHGDCTLLPNTIYHNDHGSNQEKHLLCLAYDIAIYLYRQFCLDSCFICEKEVFNTLGYYLCTRCKFIAHVKCATSPNNFHAVSRKDAIGELKHFPLLNEHNSAVQYLLENTSHNDAIQEAHKGELKLFNGVHEHPLMFQDHILSHDEGLSSSYLCNGCIQPIQSPYYSCSQCVNFFLHQCCTSLPSSHSPNLFDDNILLNFSPLYIPSPVSLVPSSNSFFSTFLCQICDKYSNGFMYKNKTSSFDLECAFLPRAITHEAHSQSHILLLIPSQNTLVCCRTSKYEHCYECSSCHNFSIHPRCAFLPLSIRHQLDRHFLELITNPSTFPPQKEYEDFCEICENQANMDVWFYGCRECNTIFHIDCIPSVGGKYYKIKFGGTIQLSCHKCPLTSIPLLTSYSYPCWLCKETIQGREDGIAFECYKCGFWLHFDCAKKEWNKEA